MRDALTFPRKPASFGNSTMLKPAYAATQVVTPLRQSAKTGVARNAIAAILTPADIIFDLDVPAKARALEFIAKFVGARHGLLDGEVYANLSERETIGSTALGCGVAIPHARVKGLSGPVAAFVRMKNPIPFDAPDGKPVSDMLVLLVPQDATEAHLLLLAQVAEMFCAKSFREGLRACTQAAGIHAAFTQWRQRQTI
jgi:PTS system nitrogen regulatory IIA component